MMDRDIVEHLRLPVCNEVHLKAWDGWRAYIKRGGDASWPRDEFESILSCVDEDRSDAANEILRLRSDNERMREALDSLVNAKALGGVEELVAGWEGPEKQYARHPANMGAQIKTTCGRVYELRDLIVAARSALSQGQGEGK